eukprot:PITA_11608
MLVKDNEVKWNHVPHDSFNGIKEDLAKSPILASMDYSTPFYIFSFASPLTIAVVLLQKNKAGHEQPVSFFSQVLRDAELKYNILEKKAYALVKYLKSFHTHALQSKVTTFVPTAEIKDMLVQGDNEGKRSKWITKIQKYELEIKPTNLIKGQGLAQILYEFNYQALGINLITKNSISKEHQSSIRTSEWKIYAQYEVSQCITIRHSTTYYPQGNVLVESSNKTVVRILKKIIAKNKSNWDSQLKFALWADRVTPKRSTGVSPFELVYGKAIVFPVQLAMSVAKLLQEAEEEPSALTRRIHQLVELQESREHVEARLYDYQQKMKLLFDKKAKDRPLQLGDLVLRWDVRQEDKGKHGKFDPLWFGPFKIVEERGNNTFLLENLDGELQELLVNVQFLKFYF